MKKRTVEQLCEEYLKIKEKEIKSSTVSDYHSKIHKRVLPIIGDVDAGNLTCNIAADFISYLLSEEYSESYVHDIGVLMRSVFRYAEKKYGYRNVFNEIKIPRSSHKSIEILSPEDRETVLKYGGVSERLALTMGLRIGEICGLMGKDVNNGILTVRRTVKRIMLRQGGTKIEISTPKTCASNRLIPIPENIRHLLKAENDKYIIGKKYSPVEPRTIEYRWEHFCRDMGVKYINFHGLRHTFATNALEKGMDVKTLSEILGHSTVELTMDLYCHPTMEHKKKCMNMLWS